MPAAGKSPCCGSPADQQLLHAGQAGSRRSAWLDRCCSGHPATRRHYSAGCGAVIPSGQGGSAGYWMVPRLDLSAPALRTLPAWIWLQANRAPFSATRIAGQAPSRSRLLSGAGGIHSKQSGAVPGCCPRHCWADDQCQPESVDALSGNGSRPARLPSMPKRPGHLAERAVATSMACCWTGWRWPITGGDLERAVTTLFTLVEARSRAMYGDVYARVLPNCRQPAAKPAMALQTLQKALALAPASVPLQRSTLAIWPQQTGCKERHWRLPVVAAKPVPPCAGRMAAGRPMLADRQQWPAALGGYRQAHQLAKIPRGNRDTPASQPVQCWAKGRRLSRWCSLAVQSSGKTRPCCAIWALALQRNEPVAAARMQQALVGNADNVEAAEQSGSGIVAIESTRRAVTRAERASALAPADADVPDTTGWMLNKPASVVAGLQLLQRAVLKTDDPQIQYHWREPCCPTNSPAAANHGWKRHCGLGIFRAGNPRVC